MEVYYEKCMRRLVEKINELTLEIDNPIILTRKLIEPLLNCTKELKKYVSQRGFKNIDEEIRFFKFQKPTIISRLIYYNTIYKTEKNKPQETVLIEKYYRQELRKLKRYFDSNIGFYKYYRNNSTHLDEKYFLRDKFDIKQDLDSYYFVSDPEFSTSHDYKVARIMANDLLQIYFESQLRQINQKNDLNKLSLTWTSSKAALTELIYALHAQEAFNRGQVDIKFIAKTFEEAFNTDLGDFYHTFMEIKSRKMNYTKFLDKLRDALVKKMEDRET